VILEKHLAACPHCCELVERAPGDSFLNRLRAADSAAAAAPGRSTDAPGVKLAAAPPIPPELIDHPRYRVLGLVGEGGMGAVYRAEHRHMGRQVALKVIHPGLLQDPAAVRRFQQEVRAAARLHHANIVHAYDADEARGLHFLVMEYVEGISLAELVRERGPLPAAEACEYVRQAALGLQHANEKGMVHRDIKPHNLMLQWAGGLVKILDFGLARLTHAPDVSPAGAGAVTGRLTGVGTVMGTADYIAPEQAADAGAADIRADVYALGCTLFYLLTGRPPFPGGAVLEKLARHAGTALPPLGALRPDVPAGLGAVLSRMTAKDPAARHPTPAAVAEALARFCPAGARRPSLGRKLLRVAVAALLLFAAGLVAAVVIYLRLGTDRGQVAVLIDTAPAGPTDQAAEENAVRTIQGVGGRVARRDHFPDSPVVAVLLGNSQATDTELAAVASCKHLERLELTRTAVTDEGLKRLTGLSHLTALALGWTHVTDAGMKDIAELKTLETLELQLTPVGDAGLKPLAGLPRLRTLWLNGTRVTAAGMADIGQLKTLTYLNLSETPVADAGLERLTGLDDLATLELFHAWAVGDEGMKSVARLGGLHALDICGTRVTDAGLAELAGCTQLTSLRVGGLRVTDAGLKSLAGMTRLSNLDLTGTDVTDEGLREVARHRGLEDLNLQGAHKVTDAGLKDLAGLPRLRSLGLAGTDVTDAGLAELARCASLRSLTLRGAGNVTDAAVAGLRKARPELQIYR
jgi:hypothetical protein